MGTSHTGRVARDDKVQGTGEMFPGDPRVNQIRSVLYMGGGGGGRQYDVGRGKYGEGCLRGEGSGLFRQIMGGVQNQSVTSWMHGEEQSRKEVNFGMNMSKGGGDLVMVRISDLNTWGGRLVRGIDSCGNKTEHRST